MGIYSDNFYSWMDKQMSADKKALDSKSWGAKEEQEHPRGNQKNSGQFREKNETSEEMEVTYSADNKTLQKLAELYELEGVSPKLIIAASKAYKDIAEGRDKPVRIPPDILSSEALQTFPKWVLLGWLVGCAYQDEPQMADRVLTDFAKKGKAYQQDMKGYFQKTFGNENYIKSGLEAAVYNLDENTVVKESNLQLGTSNVLERIERVMLGNFFFPETAYTPFALGKSDEGELEFGLKQRKIQLENEEMSDDEIEKWLKEKGWKIKDSFLRNYVSENGELCCMDMHGGNIVRDRDGNIVCIDPCVVPNSYERDMGGHYDYDNPPMLCTTKH